MGDEEGGGRGNPKTHWIIFMPDEGCCLGWFPAPLVERRREMELVFQRGLWGKGKEHRKL